MPCSDSKAYDDMLEEGRRVRAAERINKLTRLLCDACQLIEFYQLSTTPEIKEWWEKHQKSPGHIRGHTK